jgi:hypothetical protein
MTTRRGSAGRPSLMTTRGGSLSELRQFRAIFLLQIAQRLACCGVDQTSVPTSALGSSFRTGWTLSFRRANSIRSSAQVRLPGGYRPFRNDGSLVRGARTLKKWLSRIPARGKTKADLLARRGMPAGHQLYHRSHLEPRIGPYGYRH